MIEALDKFVNDGVSALPIVCADGKLTNIYSKFDVINLAATKSYSDLEITLKEATEHKIHFDGVYSCKGNFLNLKSKDNKWIRAKVSLDIFGEDDIIKPPKALIMFLNSLLNHFVNKFVSNTCPFQH